MLMKRSYPAPSPTNALAMPKPAPGKSETAATPENVYKHRQLAVTLFIEADELFARGMTALAAEKQDAAASHERHADKLAAMVEGRRP